MNALEICWESFLLIFSMFLFSRPWLCLSCSPLGFVWLGLRGAGEIWSFVAPFCKSRLGLCLEKNASIASSYDGRSRSVKEMICDMGLTVPLLGLSPSLPSANERLKSSARQLIRFQFKQRTRIDSAQSDAARRSVFGDRNKAMLNEKWCGQL